MIANPVPTRAERAIALDFGQTATSLRMGDQTTRAAGASHHDGDIGDAVLASAAALKSAVSIDTGIDRIVADLSAYPLTDAERRPIARGLAALFGSREVWLCSDTVASHRGALPDGQGIALAVGTGVACLATNSGHPPREFDGYGYLLGDWGGGFWLGSSGLSAALDSYDGRGPKTSLLDLATREHGPAPGIAMRVSSGYRPVATVAAFAQHVLRAAAAGDRVAQEIVTSAVQHLNRTASAALRYLGGGPVVLALSGGVMQDDYIAERLSTSFAQTVGIVVTAAAGTPLDGSFDIACSGDAGPFADMIYAYTNEEHDR